MKKSFYTSLIIILSFSFYGLQSCKSGNKNITTGNNTTIDFDNETINLGTFNYSETKKSSYTVKNTGDYPLIIKNAITTCGCTEVTYDKKPIAPGKESKINITFKPNSLGTFKKTIELICNTKETKHMLFVEGFVEESEK